MTGQMADGRKLKLHLNKNKLKNWDTLNNYTDCLKNGTVWFYNAVKRQKDADFIAISVDPDQTAPAAV